MSENKWVERSQFDQLKNKVDELSNKVQEKNIDSDALNLVVLSGDLDKLLAAFIMATGAAAMGAEVNMFFTFWATCVLRKSTNKNVKKSFIDKMIGFMLPKGTKRLALSRMHYAGIGTKLMKIIMDKKQVASLDHLINEAADLGVKILICEMSMDIMGIVRQEIIDYPNLDYTGVAGFLDMASKGKISLFI